MKGSGAGLWLRLITANIKETTNRMNWQRIIFVIITALVLYLVIVPLSVAFLSTFKERGILPFEAGPLTFYNYIHVFTNPDTWKALFNTTVFAGGALALGLFFALPITWMLERSDLPFRPLIFSLVIAPIILPGVLLAISWIYLLDPNIGWINKMLRFIPIFGDGKGPLNVYSLGAMIFVESLRMVAPIVLMISSSFRGMDPSLEESSRMAGKSGLTTVFRITLPLMRPAILAAMLYYFIVGIESFEVPGILGLSAGVHLMSTSIYWAVYPPVGGLPDFGLASTLGFILILVSILLIRLYNHLTENSRRFVTVTGKGFRPQRIRLNKWKFPALLFCLFYIVISLFLPLFILIWSSLHLFYTPPSLEGLANLTLQPYINIIKKPEFIKIISNTMFLAVLTALLTIAISMFIGWFTVRGSSRFTRFLDTISFLPQALPGTMVGLAVILFYLSFKNPIYGTIFIITIAMTTRFLAYGSRTMAAGYMQIHPELEEASRVSGANWLKTFRRIIVPLVLPVALNAFLWVIAHTAREMTVVLMLSTPSNQVIATELWKKWVSGGSSEASALGVILVVVLILISWLGNWLINLKSKSS